MNKHKFLYKDGPDRIITLFRLQQDLKSMGVKGAWRCFAIRLAELIEEKFPKALDNGDIVLSAAMPCIEPSFSPGGSGWKRTLYRIRHAGDIIWIGCEKTDKKRNLQPTASQSPVNDDETVGLNISTSVNYAQVVTGADIPADKLCFIQVNKESGDEWSNEWWELNGFNLCGALIGTLYDLSDTGGYWYSRMTYGYSNDTGMTGYSASISTK